MPSAVSSDSANKTRRKQYICYICSKIFENIDILNSHKRLEHGGTGIGGSSKPQHPAGVG
jgi:hypothetical protein